MYLSGNDKMTEVLAELFSSFLTAMQKTTLKDESISPYDVQINKVPIPEEVRVSLDNYIESLEKEHPSLFDNLYRVFVTNKSDLLIITNAVGYQYGLDNHDKLTDLAVLKMGCNNLYVVEVKDDITDEGISKAVERLIGEIYNNEANDIAEMLSVSAPNKYVNKAMTVSKLFTVLYKLGLEEAVLPSHLCEGIIKEIMRINNLQLLSEVDYLSEED